MLSEKIHDATEVWQLYQKGMDHHNMANLYRNTERAFRFYEGDQWSGLESGGEELAFYNVIRPVVNYRSTMVAMNSMAIVYNPMSSGEKAGYDAAAVCNKLNQFASAQWERLRMDTLCWKVVKDACIAGDSYLYFYDGLGRAQVIDNTDIYLADEQNADLQRQQYIIIRERRLVSEVREEAKRNGIPKEKRLLIERDDDTGTLTSDDARREVDTGDGKCTCLLLMTKKNGVVTVYRSTRNLLYQPETRIDGLTQYPLVGFSWVQKKGSARGIGEGQMLIPNQLSINKLLYQRETSVKTCAYAKPVFKENAIEDPDALLKVGAAIGVSDINASDVRQVVSYLTPAQMSPDAKNLADELIILTRELAGAGDAATGQIDPTKTSGAAIIAARNQSALPLNEQSAVFKQFVEEIGRVWYSLWVAYHPNGLPISLPQQDGTVVEDIVPAVALEEMEVDIRVDVSQSDPYNKYALEQSLENALARGHITFEEYVRALPDDAVAPKSKFLGILEDRRKAAEQKAAEEAAAKQAQTEETQSMEAIPTENGSMLQQQVAPEDEEMLQQLAMLEQMGGMQSAMPQM